MFQLIIQPIAGRHALRRLIAGLLTISTCSFVNANDKQRNGSSTNYSINQTFDGEAFFKDNNVWVYTSKFAETFGMPKDGIDDQLKGIEAAAFRIEDANYKLCGMGGRADNCKKQTNCMLDVYVDEVKIQLPWAVEYTSDFESRYASLRWLKTDSFRPIVGEPPQFIKRSSIHPGGLGAWGDKSSQWEAFFVNDMGSNIKGQISGGVVVSAYKRNAINGLTMITFNQGCLRSTQKNTLQYFLDARIDLSQKALIKRYFEFELPERFMQKIDSKTNLNTAQEKEYFKKLYEEKFAK